MNWISVKDRLPDPGYLVIMAYTTNGKDHIIWPGFVLTRCLEESKIEWRTFGPGKGENIELNGRQVTHWMNLPEPPEPKLWPHLKEKYPDESVPEPIIEPIESVCPDCGVSSRIDNPNCPGFDKLKLDQRYLRKKKNELPHRPLFQNLLRQIQNPKNWHPYLRNQIQVARRRFRTISYGRLSTHTQRS